MIIKKKLLYAGLAGWMLLSGITLVGCRKNGMILETTEQNTGSQNDTAYTEDAVVGSVTERDQEDTEAIIDTEVIKDTGICVFVCGAVKQEGVYELPVGARINDALLAAGGFAENAAEQVVNLADFIEDGQRIYFPTEEEVQEQSERWQDPETETNGQTMEAGAVNINTAGKEELMSLSGIGEAKAENIITYRETQGAFEKTEDIMNVNGIGENLFQKIKNDICVGR